MTKPKPDWVTEPVFKEGDHVWLYPTKGSPRRLRGRITKVKRYGAWGQTHLYDTDIKYGKDLAVGLSAHWLKPVDALLLLSEVEHPHDDHDHAD